MKIIPTDIFRPTWRQETIHRLSKEAISRILGFEPAEEDPGVVDYAWDFLADGVHCAVWSFKGSHRHSWWPAFGPTETLAAVFGAEHVRK